MAIAKLTKKTTTAKKKVTVKGRKAAPIAKLTKRKAVKSTGKVASRRISKAA